MNGLNQELLKTKYIENGLLIELNEGCPTDKKKGFADVVWIIGFFILGLYVHIYVISDPLIRFFFIGFLLGPIVLMYQYFKDIGRRRIISLEVSKVILTLHLDNQIHIKYFVADIKQFFVKSNAAVYVILQDGAIENISCFIHGLSKEKSLYLAEMLENYLDIFDISVSKEIRK